LVLENKGGFLCKPDDSDGFAAAIGSLSINQSLCEEMSQFNKEKIKEFDVAVVENAIRSIYIER
jgi:glycosyltransferase involved in cell wall biosynthesis